MKKIIVTILCFALCLSIAGENTCWSAAQETKENYENIFLTYDTATQNGKILCDSTIEKKSYKLNKGIINALKNEEKIIRKNQSEGNEFVSSDTIYSDKQYKMIASTNNYSGILVANNNINISGNRTSVRGGTVCSINGDIVITGNHVELDGIFAAENGDIDIECQSLVIKGVLLANKVKINASMTTYEYNDFEFQRATDLSQCMATSFAEIQMDYNNEQDKLQIEDIAGKNIKMYTRYGSDKFSLCEDYQNGDLFDPPKKGDYFEAYAEYTDEYGQAVFTNIECFGCTSEGICCEMEHDEDKDGIPDGYEVREGLGDPTKKDSNNYGMSDGEAVLLYGKSNNATYLPCKFYVKPSVRTLLCDRYNNTTGIVFDDNVYAKYLLKAGDVIEEKYTEEGKKIISVYNYILDKTILKYIDQSYEFFSYDLQGNVLVKLAYDGKEQTYNFYKYKQHGISSIEHNGIKYEYLYDKEGNLDNVLLNGKSMVQIKWETKSKCIKTLADGYCYIMEYNKQKQLIRVSSKDKVLYAWEYGEEKPYDLIKKIDYVNHAEYYYEYDEQGEISKITSNDGTSYEYENGVTEWSVEAKEKNQTVKEKYMIEDDKSIYTCGNIEAVDCEEGRTVKVKGKAISSCQTLTSTDSCTEIDLNGENMKYVYNDDGLLVEIWKQGKKINVFEYNNVKELVKEISLKNNTSVVYEYDGGGNLQKAITYPLNDNGEKKQIQESSVDSYGYDDSNADRLTTFNGKKITYNALGNPVNYWNGYHFNWTQGQKLETISSKNDKYSYTYDMDGYRVSKCINGKTVKYTYQNGQLFSEKMSGNEMVYHYDASGNLLYFQYKGKTYYYELDEMASVVGILDEFGNKLVSYEYDAWGKILSIQGDVDLGRQNPFRYHSYYYDEESGFYYLQNRYYDSIIRRMVSMDEYTDTKFGIFSHNMYAYCENTPVNASNYTGNIPDWVTKLSVSPTKHNYKWKTNSVYCSTNCYGYAVKYDEKRMATPGDFCNRDFQWGKIKSLVLSDLKWKFNNAEEIDITKVYSLSKHYVVIAMRMGKDAKGRKDFHFMRRLYDSKSKSFIWTHKPGCDEGAVLIYKYYPARFAHWDIEYHDKKKWHLEKGGYTGNITYFAYWN